MAGEGVVVAGAEVLEQRFTLNRRLG
jgi:hypothetical protein